MQKKTNKLSTKVSATTLDTHNTNYWWHFYTKKYNDTCDLAFRSYSDIYRIICQGLHSVREYWTTLFEWVYCWFAFLLWGPLRGFLSQQSSTLASHDCLHCFNISFKSLMLISTKQKDFKFTWISHRKIKEIKKNFVLFYFKQWINAAKTTNLDCCHFIFINSMPWQHSYWCLSFSGYPINFLL